MACPLHLTSLCNRIIFPTVDQAQLTYILTVIEPVESMSNDRLPLNLTFVLDGSGPMAGEGMKSIRAELKSFIKRLHPEDVLAVVLFGGKARTIIQAQPLKENSRILGKVDSLQGVEGRCVASGLVEGFKQSGLFRDPARLNRLVLLLSGETDDHDKDACRRLVEEAGSNCVPIIGLGLGGEWDEDFLIDLTDRSMLARPGSRAGTVDFIPLPMQMADAFLRLFSALQVVARDVNIALRLMRGIEVQETWQVWPEIKNVEVAALSENAVGINVGDQGRCGSTYLTEVKVPTRTSDAVRIAQTELSYESPHLGIQRDIIDLVVNFSQDMTVTNPLDSYVMDFVELAQVYKLQSQALCEIDAGDVQSAAQKLRQAAAILVSQGEIVLADRIRAEADFNLRQYGQISSEGRKIIRLATRKRVRVAESPL